MFIYIYQLDIHRVHEEKNVMAKKKKNYRTVQLQQCCVRASRSLLAACWCWHLNRAVTQTNRWSNRSRCCSIQWLQLSTCEANYITLKHKHFNVRGSHERGEQPFLLKRDCKPLKQLTWEQTKTLENTQDKQLSQTNM